MDLFSKTIMCSKIKMITSSVNLHAPKWIIRIRVGESEPPMNSITKELPLSSLAEVQMTWYKNFSLCGFRPSRMETAKGPKVKKLLHLPKNSSLTKG